jgi:hypothetical protein
MLFSAIRKGCYYRDRIRERRLKVKELPDTRLIRVLAQIAALQVNSMSSGASFKAFPARDP